MCETVLRNSELIIFKSFSKSVSRQGLRDPKTLIEPNKSRYLILAELLITGKNIPFWFQSLKIFFFFVNDLCSKINQSVCT